VSSPAAWSSHPNATAASVLGFKEHYQINEWRLMGAGDILLLHTDGLVDHARGDEPYFPGRLEQRPGLGWQEWWRSGRLVAAVVAGVARRFHKGAAPRCQAERFWLCSSQVRMA
jgi:hypothetical protein